MKRTTKIVMGVAAGVLLSSAIGGITAYKLLERQQLRETASFNELFQSNPDNMKLTAFSAGPNQLVDLTQAAESSVHAVVHIRATELSKTMTVYQQPDFFDFFFGDGRGRQQQVQTRPRVGFGSGVIISKDGYRRTVIS